MVPYYWKHELAHKAVKGQRAVDRLMFAYSCLSVKRSHNNWINGERVAPLPSFSTNTDGGNLD